MKKRILALLLATIMMVALAACAPEVPPVVEGDDDVVTVVTPIAAADLKVGMVLIGDEADAYSNNHIEGMENAMANLGLDTETQLIIKGNVLENADAETAILELVEAGVQIIFANSFGHEQFMVKVAADFPDVQFASATGYEGATDAAPNTHNFFAEIHEARYLAGIVAGMKTETNKLGYVAAKPFAEVISGYTAFYLGAKSVNPDVEMYVNYTNEWSEPIKEAANAKALIDMGCDVISQHSDTTAPATVAQGEGVFAVGYNADMIAAAPDAVLTSARINWGIYYEYAMASLIEGTAISQDWNAGLEEGAAYLSDYNTPIIADGTVEAVEAAKLAIIAGTLQVFAGPLVDVDGVIVVEEGEFFPEGIDASAPLWDYVLEGVNVLS